MSQIHKNTLKLLMPIEMGSDHDADLTIEGDLLDQVQTSAVKLMKNIFADTTYELLYNWERTLGITPGDDSTTPARVAACVSKIKERGGLSIPYFIQLATDFGHTVKIFEPKPFMTGISSIGYDPLHIANVIFCWRVDFEAPYSEIEYRFRIGVSGTGDRLMSFGVSDFQDVLEDLKPAHSFVYFYYPYIINETFEDAGFEEEWVDSIGAGSSLDPDNTEIISPEGCGLETLKATSGAASYTAHAERDYGSEQSISFTEIKFYIASENLPTGTIKELAKAEDSASASVWKLYIANVAGTRTLRFSIYNNGSWQNYDVSGIDLESWYRFSVQYNDDANTWAWRLDGESKNSGSLTGVHKTGIQKWILGFSDSGNQYVVETHYAQVRVSKDKWPVD